jgi:hypothetical protein
MDASPESLGGPVSVLDGAPTKDAHLRRARSRHLCPLHLAAPCVGAGASSRLTALTAEDAARSDDGGGGASRAASRAASPASFLSPSTASEASSAAAAHAPADARRAGSPPGSSPAPTSPRSASECGPSPSVLAPLRTDASGLGGHGPQDVLSARRELASFLSEEKRLVDVMDSLAF